ncbi:MAG: phosphatase PAP2 family protein [Synergistetes bacterium]|nr:phosphatase PAP2 family protein [Synergistota bacterium]MDW8191614.1 phosphatase PAP2 family protein [Synergistota bacterium]
MILVDGKPLMYKSEIIIKVGEKIGNGNYLIPTLTTLTYSSYLLNLNKAGDALKEALISGALSGIIADVIKVGTSRGRPRVSEPFSWFNYDRFPDSEYWSFPSGHTALAAGASFSLYLKFRGALKLFFLVPPVLTALSRIMTLSHWPSDVIFSLILGFLIAKGGERWCGK